MYCKIRYFFILFILAAFFSIGCSKSGGDGGTTPVTPPVDPPVINNPGISYWLTTGDKSSLLRNLTTSLGFQNISNAYIDIAVDSMVQYQSIDGFGYTLTEGSVHVINQLPLTEKNNLLNELFRTTDNGIGVSYIRLGIGATDLSTSVYSYDDMPAGQTDLTLSNFNLTHDQVALIPLLKQIMLINPEIKLLATPWSPPLWMKDNNSSVGGSLLPAYYQVYANYFVKYIQAMKAEGLNITAVTPQNEPLHPGNNPSMYMTAAQQGAFIKNNLGPAFNSAGINTKIIIYDHNCDRPDYPLEILNDAAARAYVDGSAFHLYGGDIAALSQIHDAFPSKNVYFTEQYTAASASFAGDLQWHMKNVIIGSMRNHSKVALEWNLANDPGFGPSTPGGCTTCLGAVTVSTNSYAKNVAFYIIGQASKFVPAGSKRIASNNSGNLFSVSFLTSAGKKVLIVLNDGSGIQNFNIKFNARRIATSLQGGSVATYVW